MSGPSAALHRPTLPLVRVHGGKVREVYDAGDGRLLMVASDRVSAFDVVMDEPVPRKGEVLTMLTAWWLERLDAAAPHHLLSAHPEDLLAAVPGLASVPRQQWARRSMLVRRTEPVPVECVARGYLSGSAWREYRDHGTLAGEPLPAGLQESARLPSVLFSPATKATEGHDENIPPDAVRVLVGESLADHLERRTLALYEEAAEIVRTAGLLLADTKFEFGMDAEGTVRLIDETLTPDSSRYWPLDTYAVGRGQPSLDKQPVRDYLDSLDWDKSPPPPMLPDTVIRETTRRYETLFSRLVGCPLAEWEPRRGAQFS